MNRSTAALVISICALMLALALIAHTGIVDARELTSGPRSPMAMAGYGFTYQGQLKKNGTPVNATCTFRFSVWDSFSGGFQKSAVVYQTLAVANGLFTSTPITVLNNTFNGEERYLNIGVQCPGDGSATNLPRQALTPAPYALALPGLYTQQNVTSTNLLGGYFGNWVGDGVWGATIGGGGANFYENRVTDIYGVVSGGYDNQAGNDSGSISNAAYATVAGGQHNTASGYVSMVGGGGTNVAGGEAAVIDGGYNNTASGSRAVIGGGEQNQIDTFWSTIGGGYKNAITATGSTYGTIGGGRENRVWGLDATVVGGAWNHADGSYSTVLGGDTNYATMTYTLAAGHRANADDVGAFVWADSVNHDFHSTAADQFRVRSSGGVQFVLNVDASGDPTWSCHVSDHDASWTCSSDRNLKENLIAANGRNILDRLDQIPIYYWNAIGVDPSNRHLGPVAQDFYAAYQVGTDNKGISTIDLDGVALASIQALHQQVKDKDAEIAALKAENAQQQRKLHDLETRLGALEQAASITQSPTASLLNNGWLLVGLLIGIVWIGRVSWGGGR